MADDDRQKQIDDFYRQRYGFDPSKLTPEMRAQADQALVEANNAIGHRVFWTPNGWVENPAYKKIREQGGIDADLARKLSIYQAYKNGEMPDQARPLSDDERRQHGVTDEMMKSYEADRARRDNEWAERTASRFSTLVTEQPKQEQDTKAVNRAKEDEGAAASQPASQPSSAPAKEEKPLKWVRDSKGVRVQRGA